MLPVQIRPLRLRVWSTRASDADTLVVVEPGPLERTPQRIDAPRNEAGLMSATLSFFKLGLCPVGQSKLTRSVSSMRRSHLPPHLRARRWLNSAVRRPPRWRYPVGLGANLSRAFCGTAPAAFSGARCWWLACVEFSRHSGLEASLKLRVAVLMLLVSSQQRLSGLFDPRSQTGSGGRSPLRFRFQPREIHGTGVPELSRT